MNSDLSKPKTRKREHGESKPYRKILPLFLCVSLGNNQLGGFPQLVETVFPG